MQLSVEVIELSPDGIQISLAVIEISKNLVKNCLHDPKIQPQVPPNSFFSSKN
ncbi:MAG: hypothetical protein GQ474_06375 [Sulfurimonas sp.]|nr:hypothetical protein [Sulfurimonas sp.]